jgi:soluble lytic murein transglycosylase
VRSVVTLCCFWVAWASAGLARAWNDGALCALDNTTSEASEPLYTPADEDARNSSDRDRACELESLPEADGAPPTTRPAEVAMPADVTSEARSHMRKAEALAKAGRREDALLELRVVERLLPRVADRFALRRGELLLDFDLPVQACEAYALASQSLNREVAIRAQIGSVQCALRSDSKKGERALQALLTRYPRLPQREQLRFELAMSRERAGNLRAAAALLRGIDLAVPATPIADRARVELGHLAERGTRVAPYSGKERVERAEHMLFDGPFEQATQDVEALLADRTLGAELHAQAQALAAKIARIQGRFDQTSAALARAGAGKTPAAAAAVADPDAERELAERRIKTLRAGKPIARLNNGPLRSVFEVAVAHRMKDVCDETIDAMLSRRKLEASVRFDAAMRASGLASDDKIAALLEPLSDIPRYRLAARYHYARALERLGRTGEAEVQYLRVIAADRGPTQYYAMWADLRLWSIQSQTRESCLPRDAPALAQSGGRSPSLAIDDRAQLAALGPRDNAAAGAKASEPQLRDGGTEAQKRTWVEADAPDDDRVELSPQLASLVGTIFDNAAAVAVARTRTPGPGAERGGRVERAGVVDGSTAPLDTPELRRRRVLAMLAPIVARHDEAYPWLARAQDLVELELFAEAADEINEAFLAFRDVTGALRLRSGLLALLTGSAPPRRPVTFAVARARRALDKDTRMTLSEIANLLGDPGVGVRFGKERLNDRPRAYADFVESAARKNGIDPNLLFAVMRVESIYNKRIISNAGAVGLMQIMPATGERIAHQLGVNDFDASELLDPQLNLDFSAWYLASLLRRFDGRLPLAIASYNGGPHNVRLWMRNNPPQMPLDVFLERIPFSQTHEYVRRVLTYYAQYRAQQNLPMTRLSVELPQLRPDTLAF